MVELYVYEVKLLDSDAQYRFVTKNTDSKIKYSSVGCRYVAEGFVNIINVLESEFYTEVL